MLTVLTLARYVTAMGLISTRTESVIGVGVIERKDKWNDVTEADQRCRDRAALD
jgi:hypothetical protein